MVYTELTCKAMRFAYAAHHGQLDIAGVPYISHPLHLAEQMDDEVTCCAALLHDVVESTPVTLEELALEFPPDIIEIVALLTHVPPEDYFSYLSGIKGHPAAEKIKLADMLHNSDPARCIASGMSDIELAEWQEKYRIRREFLLKK